MRVYSPTQTETWLTCPILRALTYGEDRWSPRRVGRPKLAAILGIAFGAGVAVYNQHRSSPGQRAAAIDAAHQVAMAELGALDAAGHETAEWERETRAKLPQRASRAVTAYMGADPFPHSWTTLGVEREYGEERARIDWLVDDGEGPLVVDYKTKLTLYVKGSETKAQALARTGEEYRHSWQQLHYCWRAEASRYLIVLAILEPRFTLHPILFEVHPEEQAMWNASAARVWAQMEAEDLGEALPWQAAEHATKYGPCPMQDACFAYRFHPTLMEQTYVRTPHRERRPA